MQAELGSVANVDQSPNLNFSELHNRKTTLLFRVVAQLPCTCSFFKFKWNIGYITDKGSILTLVPYLHLLLGVQDIFGNVLFFFYSCSVFIRVTRAYLYLPQKAQLLMTLLYHVPSPDSNLGIMDVPDIGAVAQREH